MQQEKGLSWVTTTYTLGCGGGLRIARGGRWGGSISLHYSTYKARSRTVYSG